MGNSHNQHILYNIVKSEVSLVFDQLLPQDIRIETKNVITSMTTKYIKVYICDNIISFKLEYEPTCLTCEILFGISKCKYFNSVELMHKIILLFNNVSQQFEQPGSDCNKLIITKDTSTLYFKPKYPEGEEYKQFAQCSLSFLNILESGVPWYWQFNFISARHDIEYYYNQKIISLPLVAYLERPDTIFSNKGHNDEIDSHNWWTNALTPESIRDMVEPSSPHNYWPVKFTLNISEVLQILTEYQITTVYNDQIPLNANTPLNLVISTIHEWIKNHDVDFSDKIVKLLCRFVNIAKGQLDYMCNDVDHYNDDQFLDTGLDNSCILRYMRPPPLDPNFTPFAA